MKTLIISYLIIGVWGIVTYITHINLYVLLFANSFDYSGELYVGNGTEVLRGVLSSSASGNQSEEMCIRDRAGGYSENAKKSKKFIVYMNGQVTKVKGSGKKQIEPGCEIIAVSYTHLDVYKRQAYCRADRS